MESTIAEMQAMRTLHGKIRANAGSRDQTQVVRLEGKPPYQLQLSTSASAYSPSLLPGVYCSCRSPWHIKPLEIPSLLHLTLIGQLLCLPKAGCLLVHLAL